ncbi:MAG: YidC/Oxa1 family membrane protein insertase [Lachnospiraceae bacterium]|nr:YidC/Oxa1 family membrane protein insertase [Lachnospiraceae bacterium]
MHNVLTKSNMFIIKYVAYILGILMNAVFFVINGMGIPNVGLAIIIFTVIIYMAMTPLTVKQQRFSRLMTVMQPELNKIQAKYKGKQDQVSQQKMMDETQAVYGKYGVSPTGSCLQVAIQMPILFALYQVIYKIPGYISMIGDRLTSLVTENGFAQFLTAFVEKTGNASLTQTLTANPTTETMVDTIYKLNTAQWSSILNEASGKTFESALTATHDYVTEVTSFIGLNISDAPLNLLTTGWSQKSAFLIIAAIMIPLLAWVTQVLNIKLMPTAAGGNEQAASQMKMMNRIMPLMSVFFCFTLPVGIGIYWIMGAVVRTIQQVVINNILKKEDLEKVIAKNQEKMKKKREKKGVSNEQISRNVSVNTKNIESAAAQNSKRAALEERLKSLENEEARTAAPGSLAAKANMVADYENRTGKVRKHADAKKK